MKREENENLLASAWQKAAAELSVEIIAPYVIEFEGRSYTYPLLVKSFGSNKGTLLIVHRDESEKELYEVGKKLSFFVSIVFEDLFSYERSLFIGTLNDLGWFGPDDRVPSWYTGKPWT